MKSGRQSMKSISISISHSHKEISVGPLLNFILAKWVHYVKMSKNKYARCCTGLATCDPVDIGLSFGAVTDRAQGSPYFHQMALL